MNRHRYSHLFIQGVIALAGALGITRVHILQIIAACVLAEGSAHAVTIDWVTVGDPGNAADSNGYGAVAESFQIMKFEMTNTQYTAFLNAVASTDNYSLYNPDMGNNPRGGITQSGTSEG